MDAGALEFAAERLGPGREERFAARVDCEQGRRYERRKRADVEDEAALALDHAREYDLCDLECGVDVDLDNVGNVLVGQVLIVSGHVVALADVVDEHADVEAGERFRKSFVVLLARGSKVDRVNLCLGLWIL